MKNRLSKIYYASGMISLILIPLLGYWIIDRQVKKKNNQRCIEIAMCSKDTSCNICFKCKPPFRIYKTIHLTGDKFNDTKSLLLIDSIANSYFLTNDTVNGLDVVFHDKSQYESLIKVIDICKIRHIPKYMLYESHFWLLFDYVDLRLGDKIYKTKNIGSRRRLLEGTDYDYEIQIKDKLHNDYLYSDIVGFEDYVKKQEIEQRQKDYYNYIYERRYLFGLLSLIYLVMLILTITQMIRKK
ncbi:MAG: hypothetical protein Q8928_12345 [Bacteroidota bacterium]|nr:hypothetical protein [Bacteroidota bacterium]